MAEVDTFTDGLWHVVDVEIDSGSQDTVGLIEVVVDGKPDLSNRQLLFTTTDTFLVGGED